MFYAYDNLNLPNYETYYNEEDYNKNYGVRILIEKHLSIYNVIHKK